MKIILMLLLSLAVSGFLFAAEPPNSPTSLVHSDNKQSMDLEDKTMKLTLDSASESVLNKSNLDRIKKFIIQQGETCLYSNMYNNNPCFQNQDFSALLIPDPGPNGNRQWNINCDTTKGDFNQLVIRNNNFKYRDIDFRNSDRVEISLRFQNENMTEDKLKQEMEQVVRELLTAVESVQKESKMRFNQ